MKWLEMHYFSTMVGENFEICTSEIARKSFNFSTWLEKNSIYSSEMPRNAFKHMFGKIMKTCLLKYIYIHLILLGYWDIVIKGVPP